jgi:3'-phosphoadenosine 5'-phosphosulfate sulfotransferase (PAPS reductase)/FAD synthetase
VVAFSGGKDSTAMLLRLLESGAQVDDILFFDWGNEFQEMLEHLREVETFTGRWITRLCPPDSWSYYFAVHPVIARKGPDAGKVHRTGHGWPSINRRWCTSIKSAACRRAGDGAAEYIGIAADETERRQTINERNPNVLHLYPLIDWGMTGADCLAYCRARGFTWHGLYDHFPRVSCYCCPFQRIGQLRTLRTNYPALWMNMLTADAALGDRNRGFRGRDTVADLERRFANEPHQQPLPFPDEIDANPEMESHP